MVVMGFAALAGLLVGFARGGHVSAIGLTRVKLAWLVPLALTAQIVVAHFVGLDIPWWAPLLLLGAYPLLFTVIIANRQLPGIPMIALGLAMNTAAIGANGGLMPQAPETLSVRHAGEQIALGQHVPHTKDVLLTREQIRLWWLADHLATPPALPDPGRMVLSPGDLVVASGVAWMVQGLMQPLGFLWFARRRHRKGGKRSTQKETSLESLRGTTPWP